MVMTTASGMILIARRLMLRGIERFFLELGIISRLNAHLLFTHSLPRWQTSGKDDDTSPVHPPGVLHNSAYTRHNQMASWLTGSISYTGLSPLHPQLLTRRIRSSDLPLQHQK